VVLNLAVGGCPPFLKVASFQIGDKDECVHLMRAAVQVAVTSKTIKVVILSSRGPLYISGRGFGDAGHEEIWNRTLSLSGAPEITNFAKVFEEGMRLTLANLIQSGKEVIFVMDTPELGFDPELCVNSKISWFSKSVREPCAVTKEKFDDRNLRYREIVTKVLKDFEQVKVYDASQSLCDRKWCWGMKDGQMFYRDDNHLSVVGSKHVALGLSILLKE